MANGQRSGLGDHPVIVILGVLAAVIAIVVFVTGKDSLPEILGDGKPTAESETYSDDVNYYLEQGWFDHADGNYEQAIANFNQVIELDHDFPSAYYGRGLAHRDIGNTKTALSDLQHYLELDPNTWYRKEIEDIISTLQSQLNP